MALSPREVRHVARLARLSFLPDEEERLARELSAVTEYMQQLGEVDVDGVPPMDHALDREDVFREDVSRARIGRNEAIRNAPDTDGVHFRVPKVIE